MWSGCGDGRGQPDREPGEEEPGGVQGLRLPRRLQAQQGQ